MRTKIEDFKNSHKNDTFVVFGSGPSLADWDDAYLPMNAKKIGCNTVFMHKPDLDYYFIQDSGRYTRKDSEKCYLNYKDMYDNYKPRLAKFYGACIYNGSFYDHSFSNSDCERGSAINYECRIPAQEFGDHPFVEMQSVVFSCIQFGIYCGSKNFVIVGCDVTNHIRIGESKNHDGYKKANLLDKWSMFKEFCDLKNINVEVFKPLGLKGLFKEYKNEN